MKFTKFDSLEALDDAASDWIIREIKSKNKTLISAATGNSATGTYKKLVQKRDQIPIDQLSFIKLDEWHGLEMNDAGSCEQYLQEHLLKPLQISPSKFISFDSMTSAPENECQRIQDWMQGNGPIDVCVLGLGLNGHIAFNEPNVHLIPGIHLAQLSTASLAHKMISEAKRKLQHGLTLGMSDILQSRKIMLIVNGKHKSGVLEQLMQEKITTSFPASFLWLHPHADCFYCVI